MVVANLLILGCTKREEVFHSRDDIHLAEELQDLPAFPAAPGPRISVRAGWPDGPATRSQLGADGVSVEWTPGDGFRTEFVRGGSYYYADFVTQERGEKVSFITESVLNGTDYISVYPGYRNRGVASDQRRVFDMVLPSSQVAVPGNIAEELNLAMAYSRTVEEGTMLTFKNIPALLQFRLSGEVASRVRKVTFKTSASIAGDTVVSIDDEGNPYLHFGYFNNRIDSNSITLSGTFAEDQDYYIALWPKTVVGFELEFSDGQGHFTTLRSSKTLPFQRSHIVDIGTIQLGEEFKGASAVSTEPLLYKQATAGTKPVSIAIIPDGFREPELPLYEWLAKSAVDKLFETEPYKSYEAYFNVWILKVPSAQSGASVTDGNGTVTRRVDSYFGSRWQSSSSYSDMQADFETVFDFVSTECPDIIQGIHTIDEVPVAMVINDTRYGGMSWMWEEGRGYCMVPFIYSGGNLLLRYPKTSPSSDFDSSAGYHSTTTAEYSEVGAYSPGDWRNTFIHEFGHAFARLGDEYWNGSTTADADELDEYHHFEVPYALNLSNSYTSPPWQDFLDRRSSLMARDPHYGRIGVFQGGLTHMFGCWRSERASGMIDNRQYFSAWQRYLIVQRIMTLSGDLASFNFDSWLEKDVTIDPLRDLETRSVWGLDPSTWPYDFETGMRMMGITPVGYPAPPRFVAE